MDDAPAIIVVMGVSGCGKTTVGKLVAEGLGWEFLEGDEYHSPQNIAKMGSGQPLDDADRKDWMAALNRKLAEVVDAGGHAVLACSALKAIYRDWLTEGLSGQVLFVFIKGEFEEINQRMEQRQGHYMKANMLRSQFDTLEEPAGVPAYDLALGSDAIAKQVLDALAQK
jgi:gluconokinase